MTVPKLPFDLKENHPLAPLTTLGVGGPARYFARAESEESVVGAVEFARQNGLALFTLGGGSNILVSDAGFNGLVLQIAISGRETFEMANNRVEVTAGAGEDWDQLVGLCVSNDLAGVECLSGIPGFVGGTPVQNVGAYGQEISETIVSVRCFDRQNGQIVDLSNEDCGFTYRTSIFNTIERDRYIVLSVRFALTGGGKPKLAYKDLIDYFDGRSPSLPDVREAVLSIRRSKSMVIDRDDPNSRSAGSFFKNPVVENAVFEEIMTRHADVPHFVFGEKVKIPAAWLIENAGFTKGFTLGRAGISSKHTLALINRGGATAAEIVALKNRIQTAVLEQFGIELCPEPVFIGF